MELEMQMEGNQDARLEFVKEQTKKAVETFAAAIKSSTEEQIQISFNAFTLNTSKEEAEKVFTTIMSIVAIELFQQIPELIKKITFFHSVESLSETEHCLMLHCDKTKIPPTKEEIDAVTKAE